MRIQQSEPTFGQLYMPTKSQIASVFGDKLAQNAEKSRARLTNLAKDVDIFVSTHVSLMGENAHPIFKISVSDKKGEKVTNRLFEFFSLIFKSEGAYIPADNQNIAEEMVKIAEMQKSKLKPFN